MPLPASQSFANLTGELGTSSVTIGGLTFFSDDPAATMSVTGDHHFSFGTGTGTHTAGYKTADGSNFSPTGGNGQGSFAVYTAGSYTVLLYRYGVLVSGSAFTTPAPSYFDITGLSTNIDEIRFVYTNNNLIIDDLNISAPARSRNAAPAVANLDGDAAVYTEGHAAILLDSGLEATVSDDSFDLFDSGTIEAAITGNLVSGEDMLAILATGAVQLSAGLTAGSIVSVSGVAAGTIAAGGTGSGGESLSILLNADANATHVQAIVRALTYANSNGFNPSTLDRTIAVTVTDGEAGATSSAVTVDVAGAPDAPIAGQDRFFVSIGTAIALPASLLLANDSSPAGGSLSVAGFGGPAFGTVSVDALGNFVFTSPGGGPADSFTYILSNGDATALGTVLVPLIATTADNDTISVPTLAGERSSIDGKDGADALSGGAGGDLLLGSAGGDTLDGGEGNDTLGGGGGSDTADWTAATGNLNATLDANGNGTVSAAGIGQETFIGIENVIGGGGSDFLAGNSGANILDGGSNADNMRGLGGNDTYRIDTAGDVVNELVAGSGGIDTVTSSSLGIVLASSSQFKGEIENATLLGAGNLNAIGNGIHNVLSGNSGVNVLDGGGGADALRGLGGNDTYRIDELGDVADETIAGSGGTDTVVSANIAIVLASASQFKGAIENATLTGGANLNLIGNGLGNSLTGNTGNNVLDGGLGADTMSGLGGSDTFRFTGTLGGGNVDNVQGYTVADDLIKIDNAVFAGLATGVLAGTAFFVGAAAHDADDRIIYNNATGALLFDQDGNDATIAAVQFALLNNGLAMTAGEIEVI